jgi:tetratricopeptide (TPR) repeat protein
MIIYHWEPYMRTTFLVISIFLFSCSSTGVVDGYLAKKQFYKASSHCKNSSKNKDICYKKIARAYVKKSFMEKAATYYILAGDQKAANAIYLKIAIKHEKRGSNNKAFSYYKKANADKKITELYEKVAASHLARGNYETAIEFYKTMGNIEKIKYIYKLMADKLYQEGNFKRSIPLYRKAEVSVKHIYLKVAQRLMKRNAYYQAIPYFQLAEKRSSYYYTIIGEQCLKQGKFANAFYFLEKSGTRRNIYMKKIVNSALKKKMYHEVFHYYKEWGKKPEKAAVLTGEHIRVAGKYMKAATYFIKGNAITKAQSMYIKVLTSNPNAKKKTRAKMALLKLVNKSSLAAFESETKGASENIRRFADLVITKVKKKKFSVHHIIVKGWEGELSPGGLNAVTSIRLPGFSPKSMAKRAIGRKQIEFSKIKIPSLPFNKNDVLKSKIDLKNVYIALKESKKQILFITHKKYKQTFNSSTEKTKKRHYIKVEITITCEVYIPALDLKKSFSWSVKHKDQYGKKWEKDRKLERKLSGRKLRTKSKEASKEIKNFLKQYLGKTK